MSRTGLQPGTILLQAIDVTAARRVPHMRRPLGVTRVDLIKASRRVSRRTPRVAVL